MAKKRIFIGIDISDNIKRDIKNFQNSISKLNLSIKWTNYSNIHITLNFLGDLTEIQISKVKSVLRKITKDFPSFNAKISNILFFPNINNIRIVSLAVESNGLIEKIQNILSSSLLKLNIIKKEDRIFKPHITIGRANFIKIKKEYINVFKKINLKQNIFIIDNIKIYQSILKESGAKHILLENYELKK